MNIIPFPRGPFFCAPDGRYLPALTALVIEAHALLQRREIVEQLFKLRLQQKCFTALAAAAPAAVVHRIKVFPGGSVDGVGFHIQPGSPPAPPLNRPSPTTSLDETVTTKLETDRPASVFNPMGQYPKGRYNPA